MTEKYEYFPRTFVLDCSLPINSRLLIRIVLQIRQMWLICGVNTAESFSGLGHFGGKVLKSISRVITYFGGKNWKSWHGGKESGSRNLLTGTKWSVSNFFYFLSLQHSPYYIRIARFMPRVELVQKHNFSARRLYIRGNNGKVCLDMKF